MFALQLLHVCMFFVCIHNMYRLPAVPLHGAVVVFHDPGMVKELLNNKTPLGVHLQDTHGKYNSITTHTKVLKSNLKLDSISAFSTLFSTYSLRYSISTSFMAS